MRALTGEPGRAHSAGVEDVPEPRRDDGAVLVRTLSVGICGTDAEIVAGHYGWAPPGRRRLIIGHESIGQVEEAPAGSGFAGGDLAVGIVRRPGPVPCRYCAEGAWDRCSTGRTGERRVGEEGVRAG